MSDNDEQTALIRDTFSRIWPNGDPDIANYLTPMVAKFARSDCCDRHFLDEFASGDLGKLASRIWEAMLYGRFQDLGWNMVSIGVQTGPLIGAQKGPPVRMAER